MPDERGGGCEVSLSHQRFLGVLLLGLSIGFLFGVAFGIKYRQQNPRTAPASILSPESPPVPLSTSEMGVAKEVELYRGIVTTGLDENHHPIDDIKEFPAGARRMIYLVKSRLSPGKHDVVTTFYDGAGRGAFQHHETVVPVQESWDIWTYYDVNRKVDAPGRWRLEMTVDGKKLVTAVMVK